MASVMLLALTAACGSPDQVAGVFAPDPPVAVTVKVPMNPRQRWSQT